MIRVPMRCNNHSSVGVCYGSDGFNTLEAPLRRENKQFVALLYRRYLSNFNIKDGRAFKPQNEVVKLLFFPHFI